MDKHVFVVLTHPVEGREDEFNTWYSETHVHDVVKVPGFVSAQRFKIARELTTGAVPGWTYLALYEMETDDPAATLAGLVSRASSGEIENSEAMDLNTFAALVGTAIGPKILSA